VGELARDGDIAQLARAHPGEEAHELDNARWRLSRVSLSDSVIDEAIKTANGHE